ncbi:MAG: cation-translocating P-type ATPase [Elusimicrobiota bacterium]
MNINDDKLNYPIKNPWTYSCQDIIKKLDVSADKGLDLNEVNSRRSLYGYNRLKKTETRSAWAIFVDQFKSIIIALLGAAVLLSFAFGEIIEGIAILAVIIINALLGFFTELRAVRSMEALLKLGVVNSKVRRNGSIQIVPAEELVPGDIVLFEGGDIITADIRIINASKLQADESALTGESMPVSKQTDELIKDTPLSERRNMLYKGTAVTRGSGEGLVCSVGMDTELGNISSLVQEAEEEFTHLEKQLNKLGSRLIWLTLGITALVAGAGIIRGKEFFLMIETAIALAVAAVPEGLPIVATVALARGMWRMAKRNALVNRLSAVETLGATDIICTDKTGTLTENRMTVSSFLLDKGWAEIREDDKFYLNDKSISPLKDKVLSNALEVGVLCNNADIKDEKQEKGIGEPLEIALLYAGKKAGIERKEFIKNRPEVKEDAFDSSTKMMATFNKQDNKYRISVKGAPESVIEACSGILTDEGKKQISEENKNWWMEQNDRMAEKGLRTLALAQGYADSVEQEPYKDLTLIGLVGMHDPPRIDVKDSIQACKGAGIRTVMVTGDHALTAKNIGLAVGLIENDTQDVLQGVELEKIEHMDEESKKVILNTSIFARVSPEQKLNLIDTHQKNGSIVAMTGDGVNDAPALKKANIGVAMGMRGTQVAREAADMVLKDDAFSTIVAAVEQGRVIFNNIRKFVVYLLSCNLSEIMTVFLASIANAPLPILPLQILFLNLVTDVFPALALGVGEGDKNIMNKPPRDPTEGVVKKNNWLSIGMYGFVMTVGVLGSLALAMKGLKFDYKQAVSVSFLTLAFSQLWHVFDMRDSKSNIFVNEITRNPFIWGAIVLCIMLLVVAVYVSGIAKILHLTDPGLTGWIIILSISLAIGIVNQIINSLFIEN